MIRKSRERLEGMEFLCVPDTESSREQHAGQNEEYVDRAAETIDFCSDFALFVSEDPLGRVEKNLGVLVSCEGAAIDQNADQRRRNSSPCSNQR